MPIHNYKSIVILTREKDCSFYFQAAIVNLRLTDPVPPKPIVEPSGAIGGWLPGVLGEWSGYFIVPSGSTLHNHLDLFHLETDQHRGNIMLHSAEVQEAATKVWFAGSGDLVSVALEKAINQMFGKT